MFGRKGGIATKAAQAKGATGSVLGYLDPLAKDEKLRQKLAAAILAGNAAKRRMSRQTGTAALVRRLAGDAVLRAQLIELGTQLKGAQKRAKKARSHKVRNAALFIGGIGMAAAAIPAVRAKIGSLVSGDDEFAAGAPQQADTQDG